MLLIGVRVLHMSLKGCLYLGRTLSIMVSHIARSQRDLCTRFFHTLLLSIARLMGPTFIPYYFILGPIFPKSLVESLFYSSLRFFIGKSLSLRVFAPLFLRQALTCSARLCSIVVRDRVLLLPMFVFSFQPWSLSTNLWSLVRHWMASVVISSRAPSHAQL